MLAAILATLATGLLLGWLLGHQAGQRDKEQDRIDALEWQAYWATENGTVSITHGHHTNSQNLAPIHLAAPPHAVGLVGMRAAPARPRPGYNGQPRPEWLPDADSLRDQGRLLTTTSASLSPAEQ